MTVSESFAGAYAVPRTAVSLSSAIKSFARRAMTWVDGRADRYAAAALSRQLSRLSDAELRKRGLSRDILAGTFYGPTEKNNAFVTSA